MASNDDAPDDHSFKDFSGAPLENGPQELLRTLGKNDAQKMLPSISAARSS